MIVFAGSTEDPHRTAVMLWNVKASRQFHQISVDQLSRPTQHSIQLELTWKLKRLCKTLGKCPWGCFFFTVWSPCWVLELLSFMLCRERCMWSFMSETASFQQEKCSLSWKVKIFFRFKCLKWKKRGKSGFRAEGAYTYTLIITAAYLHYKC